MIQIISFRNTDTHFHQQSLHIRRIVFVEGQQVDPLLEFENEEFARHYLVFLNDTPISTGRWRYTDKGIKLERFATLTEQRNKGIGKLLLDRILDDVIPLQKLIYLHSQTPAIPFYQRNGFVISGDEFFEADLAHFKMIYSK